MRTILVPVFHDRVSSRLDCTKCFQLVKIENDSVLSVERIRIESNNQFDKVKSILALKPDSVICNGVTDFYENEFQKNNIEVLPWIYGEFEDVIENFINGSYRKSES